MRKFITLYLLLVFSISVVNAQDDSSDIFHKLENTEIEVLHQFSDVSKFQKVDEIYSKARGLHPYTILGLLFSNNNNVYNRALKKLKSEAIIKGGTHLLITHTEIDGFSQFVSFTGTVYRETPFPTAAEVAHLFEKNKTLKVLKVVRASRLPSSYNSTIIDFTTFNILLNKTSDSGEKVKVTINGKIPYVKKRENSKFYISQIKDDKIVISGEDLIGRSSVLIEVEIIQD